MMVKPPIVVALLGALAIAGAALVAGTAAAAQGDGPHKLTLWKDGDAGDRLLLRGRVMDEDRNPVAGAEIHVRQANGNAVYTPDYSGVLVSAEDGTYVLRTAVPGQYASAKHIHVHVIHSAYQPLYTEVRFKGDPNADDVPGEIPLEEARIGGEVVFVGTFDMTLVR